MFLRIVPVGNLPKQILEAIHKEIENNLNIKCRIMPKLKIPKEAFNNWRKQYNAEVVMEILSKSSEAKFIDKNIPTLMITDEDLYYNGLNFVFGLEDPEKSAAIVSIARLRPEFYDERPNIELLKERTIKEVIHELGHYFGLGHCKNRKCVMCFSPSVNDVDEKGKDFCNECKIKMMTMVISLGERP
jgi:archaemetzincin